MNFFQKKFYKGIQVVIFATLFFAFTTSPVYALPCGVNGGGTCPGSQSCVCDHNALDIGYGYGWDCHCDQNGGGGDIPQCPAGTVVTWNNPPNYACQDNHYGPSYAWKRQAGCCSSHQECQSCAGGYHGKNCIICDQVCDSIEVEWGYCGALCSTTTPTALTYSTSTQTLTWTAGTGGTSQKLYVSADQNQVTNNCSLNTSPGCIVNNTNATSPYSLVGLVNPGTVYYAKVVNYESSSCSNNSSVLTLLSSCSFSSSTVNVVINNSTVLGTTINSNAAITSVTFTSDDPEIASVTNPDTTYPYSTTVTGESVGTTTLNSNVYFGATLACTASATANVLTPDPWWQVGDGDVGSNGDLNNTIPSGKLFGLPGAGGYAGVASYATNTNLTTDNVSANGWLAGSPIISPRVYNYDYFVNQIPSSIALVANTVDTGDVPGSLTSGSATHDNDNYYWYKYDGAANSGQPLTIPATDLGSRKVILLVDNASVNITGDINVTDGQGFFMLIAKGNVLVDPTVGSTGLPNLEGIYFADGSFSDSASDTQLYIRGSLVANSGTTLQRDLGGILNSDNPSEFIEYAPDQMMLFPKVLGTRRINWKEVAP
ncbi:MAG TPA: hypothetical protein VKC53_04015 [Patescibacteria group bacterium]|nr:hypothetical protein [Patescibacteria group bacterium]